MTCQEVRAYQDSMMCTDRGWHFSYLGGPEKIREKINAFSHQEMNIPKFTGNIDERVEKGIDLFDRNYKFERVDLKEMPEYIINNANKYQHLFR
jgi:beta-1,4-mannosyl-glycoprotein beta-1,4-N-acetylglucosaminyltransferase